METRTCPVCGSRTAPTAESALYTIFPLAKRTGGCTPLCSLIAFMHALDNACAGDTA